MNTQLLFSAHIKKWNESHALKANLFLLVFYKFKYVDWDLDGKIQPAFLQESDFLYRQK